MKSDVYYFSATGNSLQVARDLARNLGEVPLIAFPSVMADTISSTSNTLIVVFPIYAWGLPRMVRRFVEALSTRARIYAVCTCGGFPAASLLRALCRRKGLDFRRGFVVPMPDNYIPFFKVPGPERQRAYFRKAQEKIQSISEAILEDLPGQTEANSPLINWFFSFIHRVSMPSFHRMAKHYHVDDQCNGCGLCERICPTGNVSLVNGRPQWGRDCEQCLACLHWCPPRAVNFGKRTARKDRYHHPDVEVRDLFLRP